MGSIYILAITNNNKVIHEQKAEESNHKNISFDIAIKYIDTPL
jgi:hypothetical protein